MPQSPTYWSDRMCVTHVRTSPHLFYASSARGAFPVNVRFGRRRWRCGGEEEFRSGSEGVAVRRDDVVVTRTGHCHPRGYRRHDPPMQNHPLSRSMGNYFLSVDYGVNFQTTRSDHFERDTAPVREIAGNRSLVLVFFSFFLPRFLLKHKRIIISSNSIIIIENINRLGTTRIFDKIYQICWNVCENLIKILIRISIMQFLYRKKIAREAVRQRARY